MIKHIGCFSGHSRITFIGQRKGQLSAFFDNLCGNFLRPLGEQLRRIGCICVRVCACIYRGGEALQYGR